MGYKIKYDDDVIKYLDKMDNSKRKILLKWIAKNLENCENPRLHGKPLTGNLKQFWRYRVENYRVLVDIQDNKILIFIVEIDHRKQVYK